MNHLDLMLVIVFSYNDKHSVVEYEEYAIQSDLWR